MAELFRGKLQDNESDFLSDLLPLVNEGLPIEELFSTAEATLACESMGEANELMISEGIVYRI